jgi:hypothetical protein
MWGMQKNPVNSNCMRRETEVVDNKKRRGEMLPDRLDKAEEDAFSNITWSTK